MKKLAICLFAILLAVVPGSSMRKTAIGGSPRLISCTIKPLRPSSRHHSKEAPHIRLYDGTSLNWSGYAAVAGALASPETDVVTAVAGYWNIPQVAGSAGQYSALWVGIDGYADGTVQQLGTEQDVVSVRKGRSVVTTAQNYVWFEMYPMGSYEISGFPAEDGDLIGAGVAYAGGSRFTLAITNFTQKKYYVVPASYSASKTAARSSAEWVAEAPSSNRGTLPLADFGVVAFSGCSATIGGVTGTISDFSFDPLTMATTSGTVKAAPSALSSDGSSFTVTWNHD